MAGRFSAKKIGMGDRFCPRISPVWMRHKKPNLKFGEKKMKNRLIVFCLSAVISLALPCGAQTHYQPIDLGVLPGGSYSVASGVNDQSHVTGSGGISGANPIHGFLWQKNTGMKDLGTLGGNNSYPEGINDANQIVGQADVSSSVSDAFLWMNGTMMDIGSLGAQGSVANAINFDPLTMTFTQIAGWSPTSDNSTVHAVIWNASLQITDLGTLGGPSSFGWANNCGGQVVGRADIGDWDGGPWHAGRELEPGKRNQLFGYDRRVLLPRWRHTNGCLCLWSEHGDEGHWQSWRQREYRDCNQ